MSDHQDKAPVEKVVTSASLLHLSDHEEYVSSVLAPHGHLAPEILTEIFLILLSLERETTFPPNKWTAPWSIGQVSQLWRNLSRGDVRIWKPVSLKICIDGPIRACSRLGVLPPFVSVEAKISPLYLFEIRTFFARMPPVFFERLCALHITLRHNSGIQGLSYDLENLADRWNGRSPFTERFTRFTLDMMHRYDGAPITVIAPLIPWQQLTHLSIQGNIDDPVQALLVLRKCQSLEVLALSFRWPAYTQLSGDPPLHFPSIKSIEIRDIFNPVFESLWHPLWTRISSLHISNKSFTDTQLLVLLDQCVLLKELGFHDGNRVTTLSNHTTISMPHLERLTVTTTSRQAAMIILFFRVPSLKTLSIRSRADPMTNPVDYTSFHRMIHASQCKITSLTVDLSWQDIYNKMEDDFYNLLAIMPALKTIDMGTSIIDDEHLRVIGDGDILPQLEVVRCATLSATVFIREIERRARSEAQQGRRLLRRSTVVVDIEDPGFDCFFDTVELNAERVRATYGIDLSLDYTDNFEQ